MILPDHMIESYIKEGRIGIHPPIRDTQLQPSSLDLRLGDIAPDPFVEVTKAGWIIHPGARVLGSTLDNVRIPNDLVGKVDGRSSLGRKFLLIHATAGLIDPGWQGTIVLEIANLWPVGHPNALSIELVREQRVAQISFEVLSAPCRDPYGSKRSSKYQGQTGIVSAREDKEF